MNIEKKELLGKIFEFGIFEWRVHREFENISKSPFKIQFRHLMRANLELCEVVCNFFIAKIKELGLLRNFDAIAELPLSISPVATLVSQKLNMPMVTLDYKNNRLLGRIFPGIRLLVLEDVLSFGHSKRDALRLAKEHSLKVVGIIVFVDYNLGAVERIKEKHRISVYSIYTINGLLNYLGHFISLKDKEDTIGWLDTIKKQKYLLN